jgi:hypothetical protein
MRNLVTIVSVLVVGILASIGATSEVVFVLTAADVSRATLASIGGLLVWQTIGLLICVFNLLAIINVIRLVKNN